MQPRISMITLGVRDLERSIGFYEHGLGFPRMESPPEVAFFTLNGTWLGLFGRDALAEDAGVPSEGGGFNAFSLAHNVASETEVDAVVQQAVEAGATLIKKPEKVFWGGIAATSQIRMAICGKWHTIHTFGWVPVASVYNKSLQPTLPRRPFLLPQKRSPPRTRLSSGVMQHFA